VGKERFLQFVVPQIDGPDKIVAFLRLSLPKEKSFIKELEDSAVIREIHVYGQAVKIGKKSKKRPQHLGFGTRLIQKAKEIAIEKGYGKLAVISGIGTREYYRKKGFKDGELYQFMILS
jgi:elongator complex protein 3